MLDPARRKACSSAAPACTGTSPARASARGMSSASARSPCGRHVRRVASDPGPVTGSVAGARWRTCRSDWMACPCLERPQPAHSDTRYAVHGDAGRAAYGRLRCRPRLTTWARARRSTPGTLPTADGHGRRTVLAALHAGSAATAPERPTPDGALAGTGGTRDPARSGPHAATRSPPPPADADQHGPQASGAPAQRTSNRDALTDATCGAGDGHAPRLPAGPRGRRPASTEPTGSGGTACRTVSERCRPAHGGDRRERRTLRRAGVPNLHNAVALLPTPTSTDHKASGASYAATDTHHTGRRSLTPPCGRAAVRRLRRRDCPWEAVLGRPAPARPNLRARVARTDCRPGSLSGSWACPTA